LVEEENENAVVEAVQNKINEIDVSLTAFKLEYREAQELFSEKIQTQLSEIITAVVKK